MTRMDNVLTFYSACYRGVSTSGTECQTLSDVWLSIRRQHQHGQKSLDLVYARGVGKLITSE